LTAAVALALTVTLAACSGDRAEDAAPAAGAGTHPASAAAPSTSSRPRIVFLGDSLTAGLGLSQAQAYPALIDERLRAERFDFEVVNAGISGDTAAGGRRRLNWALDGDVRVLVLALGANDGLRGSPVDAMRDNLRAIIREAKGRNITVLLLGMEAPPNFGPEYTASFRQVFRDLADEEDVAFHPFFLDGVAGVPALNQADGLHPNAEGAARVADLVWSALEPLVEDAVR
jgi:acyl-CoA thioesterase-1